MHKGMSDDKLQEAMKIMAQCSGVNFGAGRINALDCA